MRNRRPEVNAEMTRMIARPDKEDSDSKTQVHSTYTGTPPTK